MPMKAILFCLGFLLFIFSLFFGVEPFQRWHQKNWPESWVAVPVYRLLSE